MEKEDALIAATALVKKLPLVTRNVKHYKSIQGLILFKG
jgi:predicted nucleic acid-binding protein